MGHGHVGWVDVCERTVCGHWRIFENLGTVSGASWAWRVLFQAHVLVRILVCVWCGGGLVPVLCVCSQTSNGNRVQRTCLVTVLDSRRDWERNGVEVGTRIKSVELIAVTGGE